MAEWPELWGIIISKNADVSGRAVSIRRRSQKARKHEENRRMDLKKNTLVFKGQGMVSRKAGWHRHKWKSGICC